MKKILFLSAVALGAATFTSCSQDEDYVPSAPAASKVITFCDPYIGSRTRAEVTSGNITSQTFKVWADRKESGATTWTPVFAGTTLSYSGGKWTPATNQIWYYDQDYRFMAIAPSAANATYQDGKIRIADIPCVAPTSTGTDYLVSSQVSTTAALSATSGVGFTMKHIMSKFQVELKKTGSYDVWVSEAKIWLPAASAKASYAEVSDAGPVVGDTWTWSSNTYTDQSAVPTTTTHQQIQFSGSDELTTQVTSITSPTYFIAPNSNLIVYLDLTYEIQDSNNVAIRKFTKTKVPVKVACKQGTFNKLVVTFDSNAATSDITFGAVTMSNWTTGAPTTTTY